MEESERGIEVVGRTLDEAVQAGLEHLNLKREEVDVEILSDGARSLFGFRPGQVRVRVVAKSQEEKTREDKGERQGDESLLAVSLEEEAQIAHKILAELLRRMSIRARVELEPGHGEEPTRLNIRGNNLGMLIGRRGETLAAIQFLLRMMTSHQVERWVNLVVDVDDYRKKREESLRRLAIRMAEIALESGKTQELEPMSPAERRVIHITLRDFEGVRTESTGEGESRRVTIIPVRN